MLNEYLWISCCACGKEPSVNFTNISKKWFLPLGSSKGKREARGDGCWDRILHREEASIEKGWWGLGSKTASSKRGHLNWVLKDSYELAKLWRWEGIAQHSENGERHNVCRWVGKWVRLVQSIRQTIRLEIGQGQMMESLCFILRVIQSPWRFLNMAMTRETHNLREIHAVCL